MPQITLSVKYAKNRGAILSPAEVDALYFYGSQFYSKDGTSLQYEVKRQYISSAQEEIEKFLNIKFSRQLVEETIPFFREDYINSFPILKTNYPVVSPLAMIGLVNKMEQIIYPKEWLMCRRDSEGFYNKRISVVPNGTAVAGTSGDVILTGMTAQIGMQRYPNIPDYWTVQYITGWGRKDIPNDLINLVGKFASLGQFNCYGDIILGAGIASMSLGIDGLSQSISTTSSATNAGFGSRIIQYTKEIQATLKNLKTIYKGINFTVC